MAAFSPLDLFVAYDQAKLVTLATKSFILRISQVTNYQNFHGILLRTFLMFLEVRFKILKNLCELSVKVVDTRNMNNIMFFTGFLIWY